jgi:hypothetical protein
MHFHERCIHIKYYNFQISFMQGQLIGYIYVHDMIDTPQLSWSSFFDHLWIFLIKFV